MGKTPPVYLLTHEFHPQRGGIATFTEEMARAAVDLGFEGIQFHDDDAVPELESLSPAQIVAQEGGVVPIA
jgi:hypothetical protein